MATLVQKPAPEFTATAVTADDDTKQISLADYRGKYVILFFYPLDFTFVCPSEIIAFDQKHAEFAKRDCAVLGCSVDSEWTHLAWRRTPRSEGGIGPVQYPLIADLDKTIGRRYGVLFGDKAALRALFLIDKNGVVRHELVNDLPLGRNVDEALRLVDALRFVDANAAEDLVCPANWTEGADAMKASTEGVAEYLAAHSG